MKDLMFEWDDKKNIANQKKHKVSFEEARSVFYDDNARLIHDPDHANDDQRNYDNDGEGDACDSNDGYMGPYEDGADCGGISSPQCEEVWAIPYGDVLIPLKCIPILLHGDYTDAADLLDHLNNGAAPSNVSKVVRIDPATGVYDAYMNYKGQWIGNNFSIQSGQGYGIIVRSDINGWKPRTQ